MANYIYSFKPGTFKANPKQYHMIGEEIVALHLTTGSETHTKPGTEKEPPQERIARAVTQADLEYLYHEKHPFVMRKEKGEEAFKKTALAEPIKP